MEPSSSYVRSINSIAVDDVDPVKYDSCAAMKNGAVNGHTKDSATMFVIRKAEERDAAQIYKYMVELTQFLSQGDVMTLTADELKRDLFGERPVCNCIVVTTEEDPSTVVAYSLYFPVYVAWVGLSMYMEDLFVAEGFRGKGLGKRLWQRVTQIALSIGCKSTRLCVENWNKNAKDLYVRHGCIDMVEALNEHMLHLDRSGMEKFVKPLSDLA